MLSDEFKSAVATGNVLRTRIMLKDSLIVDPTSASFMEMHNYAKVMMKNLHVPFDGGFLEEDSSKWNDDTMNREMVELINNFSIPRINHLRKVISEVRSTKIKELKEGKSAALKEIHTNVFQIHKIYSNLQVNADKGLKQWSPKDIAALESTTVALLQAINEYKNK